MNKIDTIENKIFDNKQKIKKLGKEIEDLMPQLVDAYLDKQGLVKNQTIVDFGGEKYLVAGIYCNETSVAFNGDWLTGYKIKKDGKPGSQLKTIYNGWKIIK